MPDIRLVQNTWFPNYNVTLDWSLLNDGTLDDTQALATAMCVALGTNRLAMQDDELPDPDSTDRMGWWGDLDAQEIWNGWPIGTRLWELTRSKITGSEAAIGSTVTRVEVFIREAVQPFVDTRVGSRLYVEATRVGIEQIDALVRLYRGPILEIDLRFQILWDDIQRQGGGFNIGRLRNP
jgi:phage gp46-like protein